MYKEIIDYILQIALRHKAIKTAKYQSSMLINQQGNNAYMQFVVEDDVYAQNNITTGIFTLTLNIDILAFVTPQYSNLEAQSDAFQVAVEVLSFIENDAEYQHLISIYDYSFLSLSHFTDDNCSGQRITLELNVPNPVSMCTLLDNFDDEPKQQESESLELNNGDECTQEKFTMKQTITLKPKNRN